jgi:ribosomal-protein-alanine N-acetyltransferase
VADLQRLSAGHAGALLLFEQENRAYFARSIPDRGDDFFTGFAARHAALLAEQETGACHFHVLVGDAGEVLGRFNLVDVTGGGAELGYRIAEAASGRGLAKDGVRQVSARARDHYGLSHLLAKATLDNPASLAVLRAGGFSETGPVLLNGKPGLRFVLALGTLTR